MRKPADDELIQGEIDGVNTAEESALLKEALASNPSLAARFGSLKRVAESLGGAERFDPPAGFADGVMVRVRRRKPETAERPGWREAFRSLFAPAPLAACACALVAGFVLGGLVPSDSGLFSGPERAALSGTALSHGRLGVPRVLDQRSITREDFTGEAVTRIENGLVVVDFELYSERPFDASLDLDGTGLSPRAFSQDGPSGGEVVIAEGEIRFSHPAGRRRYSVSFGVGEPAGRAPQLRVGDGEGWGLSPGREGLR